MTAEQADTLAKATRRRIENMVCFSYRFKAAARYARDSIAQGRSAMYTMDMQYFRLGACPGITARWLGVVKSRTGSGALGDPATPWTWCSSCHGKEYTPGEWATGTYVHERKLLPKDGEGTGKVDVDDFCNYMADMEDGISASFQITRFGFGRGNYQRMEIYGSEGAIVYSLDAQGSGVDEIEVCSTAISTPMPMCSSCPFRRDIIDQMQSLCRYPQRRGRQFGRHHSGWPGEPACGGRHHKIRRRGDLAGALRHGVPLHGS